MIPVYIGYDPRELGAYAVAAHTVRRHGGVPHPIILSGLRASGLYTRKTYTNARGQLMDDISGHPMSTEFAVSRFFVPHIHKALRPDAGPWVLYVDCDVMLRTDLSDLEWYWGSTRSSEAALFCVKHAHVPSTPTKMDGQVQSTYHRKNWSSVMLINCGHPAVVEAWSVEKLNSVRGLDLHTFKDISDDAIHALPRSWNYLVGETELLCEPALVHWTSGGPWLKEYADAEYADEWRLAAEQAALRMSGDDREVAELRARAILSLCC